MFIENKNEILSIEDISYNLNKGRNHFEKRCAIVAGSLDELQVTLKHLHDKEKSKNIFEENENVSIYL